MLLEALESPLPKPRRDPVGYALARVLEALLESIIALEFLEKGYTRNAAGKAFQAWKALTAVILAFEKERVEERLGGEERDWLLRSGLLRVPSSRMKALGQLVEDLGYPSYGPYTDRALDLHDYRYHGPDPSGELSKYATRLEAARDIVYLLERLVEVVDERLKSRLAQRGVWSSVHEDALNALRRKLGEIRGKLQRTTP